MKLEIDRAVRKAIRLALSLPANAVRPADELDTFDPTVESVTVRPVSSVIAGQKPTRHIPNIDVLKSGTITSTTISPLVVEESVQFAFGKLVRINTTDQYTRKVTYTWQWRSADNSVIIDEPIAHNCELTQKITYSVQFFGSDPTFKASILKAGLEREVATEAMRTDNIGLVKIGRIINSSYVSGNTYIKRATVDVTFSATMVYNDLDKTYGIFSVTPIHEGA